LLLDEVKVIICTQFIEFKNAIKLQACNGQIGMNLNRSDLVHSENASSVLQKEDTDPDNTDRICKIEAI
jgi:hypothetical protein